MHKGGMHGSMVRCRYRKVGYGVPTLIVATSTAVDQLAMGGLTYYSESQCWMRPNLLFLWSFLVPVFVTMVINMGMLTLAMYR